MIHLVLLQFKREQLLYTRVYIPVIAHVRSSGDSSTPDNRILSRPRPCADILRQQHRLWHLSRPIDMSRMRQQQPNGFLNGNDAHIQRFHFDDSSRETSDAERSRSRGPPGGYGAFGRPSPVQPTSRLDRGHAQRRSRDYGQSGSRSRSRVDGGNRYGPASGQIEGTHLLLDGNIIKRPQEYMRGVFTLCTSLRAISGIYKAWIRRTQC